MASQKSHKIFAVIVAVILIAFIGKSYTDDYTNKKNAYETGMQYYNVGDYSEAYGYFLEAGDYCDARSMVETCDQKVMDEVNASLNSMRRSSGYSSSKNKSSSSSSVKKSSSSSTSKSSSSKSYSKKSYSSGSKSKTSKADAYDEGYDDVYMDEDYDWDRYQSDDDYARGVDDAIEDDGGDW